MKLNRSLSIKSYYFISKNCTCRCSFCKSGSHCGLKENGCSA